MFRFEKHGVEFEPSDMSLSVSANVLLFFSLLYTVDSTSASYLWKSYIFVGWGPRMVKQWLGNMIY